MIDDTTPKPATGKTPPTIGDLAPDFTLPRDGGALVTLSALRPGKVVLYFYPKDDTPGCTTEALDFTRLAAEFAATGTTVLGISRDSQAKHEKFVAKHDLGVALLSDPDGAVCQAYGAWGEKRLYGKFFLGITRMTLLIDGAGAVAQIWPKVSVKGHAEAVLQAARALPDLSQDRE